MLRPRPLVLFLAACYSEIVLQRAKEEADWRDRAIVYVQGKTPIEIGAYVAFQRMFYPALLRGETAGEAFDAAQQYVANDMEFGDLSVPSGAVAPSEKFQINESGRSVRLPAPASMPDEAPQDEEPEEPLRRSMLIRRASERFVGRQREMAQAVDALLPRRAGVHRGLETGDRRIVTLTKEGGIGKTAIALEVTDWAYERELFPGGMFELSCERLTSSQEFLSQMLTLLGIPPENQRGDLLGLLAAALGQIIPPGRAALLLLDNLDDLFGQHAPQEVRDQAGEVLETILTAAPDLRVLATCRWPLGVADHETELEVPPMAEDESKDVFVSHLDSPAHRLEVKETWDQPDSAIRQLVRMSGRHPQSLRLLARQMRRPGLTLDALRDEAREDLLKVLADPLASDDETNRLKKVEVSYELSYRHLSAEGKRLFERLSRLPGGVWSGEFAENLMKWDDLFGQNWREVMEKELDYFALVHFEPEDPSGQVGTFQMLPPMVEFARRKYEAADHGTWEKTWIEFWRQRVEAWNQWISGRLPDEMSVPEDQRKAAGARQQQIATLLFARTQPNWLAVFDHATTTDPSLTRWFLLELVSFLQLSGQRILAKEVAQRAVDVLRTSGTEEDLASCLVTLGNRHSDLGEWEEARAAYTEALEIYRRLAKVHPAAFEPDVAMTLNNLGTVLRDLGDREAARDAFTEALDIYAPLAERWPAAFGQNLEIVLRNYTTVAEEDAEDPWWLLWKRMRSQITNGK